MKAELSNHGYLRQSRYSGVYLQQGAMITDRDWNAGVDRLKAGLANSTALSADTGVPRHGGLFEAFTESNTTAHIWQANFAYAGGWVVADGVAALAVLNDPATAFSYNNQADLPNAPALKHQYLYADIWEEAITAYDDADLADPGLHGAHTGFVSRRRVQIKQCTKDQFRVTDCGLQPHPKLLPEIGDGVIAVTLRSGPAGKDACDPCAESVNLERDAGNALFRAEVHDVIYHTDGMALKVVLKWSSENGAVQFARPTSTDSLQDGQVLEFFNSGHGLLMGLPPDGYGEQPERGRLLYKAAEFAGADSSLNRIRRWDGFAAIDLVSNSLEAGRDAGVDLNASLGTLDHGHVAIRNRSITLNLAGLEVRLDFSKSSATGAEAAILTGDYWLAVLRTRAADADKVKLLSPQPIGIRHHYCLLGLHKEGAAIIDVAAADKRRLSFPALTCLKAGDVGYETACKYLEGTRTVQEALDKLCARNHWALRMSAGTGQEGYEGQRLKCPIEVLVEDQDGMPVQGAKVILKTVAPSSSGDKLTDASPSGGGTGPIISLVSDVDGYVYAHWDLGKGLGVHSVSVELEAPPQGTAGKLWYAAELVERPTKKKSPTLDGIAWQTGEKFSNDASVSFDTFARGFALESADVFAAPDATSNDVLYVTAERAVYFERDVNFQTFVLCGTVSFKERFMLFTPNRNSLLDLFEGYKPSSSECAPKEGMRFRIRGMGRFIMMKSGLLDGFVPGTPNGFQIDLDFKNAGIGHPSDFEAWVYVQPQARIILPPREWEIENVRDLGITDELRAKAMLEAVKVSTNIDEVMARFKPNAEEKRIISNNKDKFNFTGPTR